jgi:hypothetical protein
MLRRPTASTWRQREKGQAIKVYCHLCGATLRSGDQYQQLDTLPHQDLVYVCRDERRCELRAAQDPLTGKPYTDPARVRLT